MTALDFPRSADCREGYHDVCSGFSGGYDTYICGCPHHWCPCGQHKRGQCPAEKNTP